MEPGESVIPDKWRRIKTRTAERLAEKGIVVHVGGTGYINDMSLEDAVRKYRVSIGAGKTKEQVDAEMRQEFPEYYTWEIKN